MTKSDLDETGKKEDRTHRNMSLTQCLQVLKDRAMRMYVDLIKALYDEGPYYLHPLFSKFAISYENWKDMVRDQRIQHAKKLLSFIPKNASTDATVDLAKEINKLDEIVDIFDDPPPLSENQSVSTNANIQQKRSVECVATTSHQRLPISSRALDIPTNVIRADILCTIFKDAEVILNNPGSITDVPSRNKD